MESTFKTRAISLSRRNFRENDLQVTVYSPDLGKMTLIARGALKPGSKLAGHIEPFILSDIMVIRGRAGDYLGSCVGREFFFSLRKDTSGLSYAGAAARILKKETREGEDDRAREIFELFYRFLKKLDQGEKLDQELLNIGFFLKFLKTIGFNPSWQNCCSCHKVIRMEDNHFSPGGVGLLCSSCRASGFKALSFPISNDSIKILRFLEKEDLDRAGRLALKDDRLRQEINRTIKAFYRYNF